MALNDVFNSGMNPTLSGMMQREKLDRRMKIGSTSFGAVYSRPDTHLLLINPGMSAGILPYPGEIGRTVKYLGPITDEAGPPAPIEHTYEEECFYGVRNESEEIKGEYRVGSEVTIDEAGTRSYHNFLNHDTRPVAVLVKRIFMRTQ